MDLSRRKLWTFRLAGILLGLLGALVVGEIALRTVVRTYSPITFDIFYRDGAGQVRLQPHARRRHASPEWNVLVETNSRGFRDAEAPPRPGQPVVLSLGDSMSFGWGVESGEAFPARLEAALGGPDRVRVLKASLPGTGTTDHLALLRDLTAERRADVVLLSFFVGNDFHDVAAGGTAQYDVVDGLLVPKGSTAPSALRGLQAWVKRKSYVAQLAAQQLWRVEQRRAEAVPAERRAHAGLAGRDPKLREYLELHLRDDLDPALEAGIGKTADALSEMQALTRRQGARLVIAVVPRSFQAHEEDRRRWQDAYGLREDDWDMDRPQRILAAWAAAHGAELVDLLPALRDAARQGRGRLFFFPDSHLNANGHAVAAEALARHFRERPIHARAGPG
jgi:lysophospholipase L1-like esterase